MSEPDLTILYLTCNRLPERWMRFQLDHLRKAVGDFPIISLSRVHMELGMNLLDTEPQSAWNIYMQMLRGARLAQTPYVAVAEDDVLYTPEHFHEFRPPMHAVSYDRSRWSLFTWEPLYSLRQRLSNCSLISPRDLLVDALAEREAKWPSGHPRVGEVGREKVERLLRVTVRPCVDWWCRNPIVQLCHESGMDGRFSRHPKYGFPMYKQHAQVKAIEIPYWGKAADIVKEYTG